jgi:hypothetical protein
MRITCSVEPEKNLEMRRQAVSESRNLATGDDLCFPALAILQLHSSL